MTWNWEQKEWASFSYDKEKLFEYERKFLEKAGVIQGSLKHINDVEHDILSVNLISDEALKTSEIEGEILDRDSLQSSIRKHFGLKTDHRKLPPKEQGIAEMMVDLYKHYHKALNHKSLFDWHSMLTNGRRDLIEIGNYRTHEDPMQIVSGSLEHPKIHFQAPPSRRVRAEMNRFIKWFNKSGQSGKGGLSPLIRAGLAHLYFESIHPFEDGNGRIGRALSEKVLSQSLGRPTLLAISHTIEGAKKDYYQALHQNSLKLHITDWLMYFSKLILESQDRTQKIIDFVIEKGKFYRRFEDSFNERQIKVLERMFREGVEGFRGGLSAENYIRITGTTRATATRDLQKMVILKAFNKTGELKATRYSLNI